MGFLFLSPTYIESVLGQGDVQPDHKLCFILASDIDWADQQYSLADISLFEKRSTFGRRYGQRLVGGIFNEHSREKT